MTYLLLILSLPTENATVRQRVWRALKSAGAAVLRDGVYLMPDQDRCATVLQTTAAEVVEAGGSAQVLRAEATDETDYRLLFDRGEDYTLLMTEQRTLRERLTTLPLPEAGKQLRKLRKAYQAVAAIDFYPGEAARQTELALEELVLAYERLLSPGEPNAVDAIITELPIADYQGRLWATRRRPWVDRLASAWLIQRFIDPKAEFLWLASPEACPSHALGFDFDGATFSHVGSRVTFETLLASFGLADPGLQRLAAVVHFLDVGGLPVAEAAGLEAILAGMRSTIDDDDRLLASAAMLFDSLYTTYQTPTTQG